MRAVINVWALEFTVLGSISANGLVLGSLLERRLLAALLVSRGAPVSSDRLSDVLWLDDAPASAVNSLQSKLSRIRSAIGVDQVKRVGRGYMLDVPAQSCDADQFGDLVAAAAGVATAEQVSLLDEALALWRGPAYGEFAHEDFARPSAVNLEHQRLSAHETRLRALIALGRHDEVVAASQELIEEDPFREPFWAARMEALARSGQSVAAMRCFQTAHERFVDETGIPPSCSLSALEQRILQGQFETGDVSSGGTNDEPAGALVATDGVLLTDNDVVWGSTQKPLELGFDGPLHRPPLIGRIRARDKIESAVQLVQSGTPRTVVIEGPVGVGKTRLVEAASSAARARGMQVLDGRCLPDMQLPLGPLGQIAAALGVERPLEISSRAHGDADLLNGTSSTVASRFVLRLVDALVSQPTVLVLDDLQWLDTSTAASVELLGVEAAARSRTEAVPLLVLLCHRPLDDRRAGHASLARIARQPWADLLQLAALDEPGTAAVVSAVTGIRPSGSAASRVHRLTEGNPLLIETLVEAWSRAGDLVVRLGSLDIRDGAATVGPADVDARLHDRWGQLSDLAGRVVTALATCPLHDFLPLPMVADILAGLLDVEVPAVISAIDDAVNADFLEGSGRLRFSAPRIRTFASTQASHSERSQLFLRLADELTSVPRLVHDATVADHFPALAVYALQEASEAGAQVAIGELATWAVRASEAALSVGSWTSAAHHLRLAMHGTDAASGHLSEGTPLDLALGLAEFRSHNEAAAQQVLLAAADRAEANGDQRTQGVALIAINRIAFSLAGAGLLPVPAADASILLERYIADAHHVEPRLAARASALLAEEASVRGATDQARAHVERARSFVSDPDVSLIIPEVEFAAGLTAMNALELSAAERLFRRSSETAAEDGDRWVASWGAGRSILTRLLHGDDAGAAQAIEIALTFQLPIRMWSELALTRALQASLAAAQGDFEAALGFVEESDLLALRSAYSTALMVSAPVAAFVQVSQGNYGGARESLTHLRTTTGMSFWPYFALLDLVDDNVDSAHQVVGARCTRLKDPPTLNGLAAVVACSVVGNATNDEKILAAVEPQMEWLQDRGVRRFPSWPTVLPRAFGEGSGRAVENETKGVM